MIKLFHSHLRLSRKEEKKYLRKVLLCVVVRWDLKELIYFFFVLKRRTVKFKFTIKSRKTLNCMIQKTFSSFHFSSDFFSSSLSLFTSFSAHDLYEMRNPIRKFCVLPPTTTEHEFYKIYLLQNFNAIDAYKNETMIHTEMLNIEFKQAEWREKLHHIHSRVKNLRDERFKVYKEGNVSRDFSLNKTLMSRRAFLFQYGRTQNTAKWTTIGRCG